MTDLCSEPKAALLSLQQALIKIKTAITPVPDSETLSLKKAAGRILATPLYSAINIPAFKNASMDGYALYVNKDTPRVPFSLSIAGTSWAGQAYNKPCLPHQCIRIFTGAVVPQGANCVVMQEQVLSDGNTATFNTQPLAGDNIRHPGEDVQKDAQLLAADKQLSAADLGLIAAAGIYKVSVKRKLRIAFFSTGNELSALGKPLASGHIYDSNRYTLSALLQNPNHEVTDLGVLLDDEKHIKNTLLNTAQEHDVIITTGGASVGAADYIQQILHDIGTVNFWKIAMKPGKPLAFGKINNSYFFGLPGNPVSVIATYQQVVLPALQQLAGLSLEKPIVIKAKCTNALKKSPGRLEFQRGVLSQAEDGTFYVKSSGKQGSHILSAASHANCYIVLAAECTGVTVGTWVEVQPFLIFRCL